jgi:hypothetical protein
VTFLSWLSQTPLAAWARGSESIWGYPTILFLHTFGLAILVGLTTAIDFRVLGFAEHVPLAPIDRFFRFVWIGFWINAVSGILLLMITPTKAQNPIFFIKMALILAGVVNMWALRRQVFRRSAETTAAGSFAGKMLAVTSLIVWTAAITAGRLMAYLGNTR